MKNPFSVYRGLPRNIYLIFLLTFINGCGMFVFPFLTLFLTEKLGMSTLVAGNIMLYTILAYAPGSILGGKLADSSGRKNIMLIFQFLSSAVFIPCGFILLMDLPLTVLQWLIPAFLIIHVLLDGFADPARSAMNTDLTTPENRKAAFSLLYLGHNLGFAVGPLVAGLLFLSHSEWIFWGNGIIGILVSILILFLLKETKPSEEEIEAVDEESSEKGHKGSTFSALLNRPFLLIFILLVPCYGFLDGQHRFALPLQLTELFGDGGAAIFGILMTVNAVTVIIFTPVLVTITHKMKAITSMILAGFLYVGGYYLIMISSQSFWFYPATFIWSMGEILYAISHDVYISNHTPITHRGRFKAIVPIIAGSGWAMSTPIGGALIEISGLKLLWKVAIAVMLIGTLGMAVLRGIESRAKKRIIK